MRQAAWLLAACALAAAGPARAADPVLEQAKALVARYSKPPQFVPTGPAFQAGPCMKGKAILAVPFNSAVPFAQDILAGYHDAARRVGFTLSEWENQGQPTQWASGISNGVSRHASLIDLLAGVDPSVVVPQIEQARAAGIPVTAGHFYDYSQTAQPALTSYVPNNFAEIGRVLAAWAIARTEGHAHVLALGPDEVVSTGPLVAAIRATIGQCPGCTMNYQNVPITDWSTRIQSVTQATLLADPKINYVLPVYDSMTQFVVPALTLTGKQDSVKVASFNGTPFVVDMVREGDVEMVLGESPDWVGRVVADHDMRELCGVKGEAHPNFPLYIFDARNAKTAGVPAQSSRGYGTDYIAAFDKLWGVE